MSCQMCILTDITPLDDYNSWQETAKSEDFKERLDTEVIVFEGKSKQYTHRAELLIS